MTLLSNSTDAQKPGAARYRQTRQNRSAKSEQRFLDAAEQVFREYGYSAGTASEIIKRSGQSTGSFYHRFGDKQQLVLRMLECYRDDVTQLLLEEGPMHKSYPDLETMLGAFSALAYDTISNNLGMYRATLELSNTEPRIWKAQRDLTEHVANQMARASSQFAQEITAPDPETTLIRAVQLIIMIMVQTLLGNSALFPSDKENLVQISVAAAIGLMQSTPPIPLCR